MNSRRSSTPTRESRIDTSGSPSLIDRYEAVRRFTMELCEPLQTEDFVVQTSVEVSPTKWHLGHTSWFFETFILSANDPGYRTPQDEYRFLFNSYYNTVGAQHQRDNRGFITRPTVADTIGYRNHVDEGMRALLARADDALLETVAPLLEIGLHHEQQHQELLLTDIKNVLSYNPLRPSYHDTTLPPSPAPRPLGWVPFDGGIATIGHDGSGFSYDNETPRHRVFLEPYRLATRLVTNGEYLAFMEDGGYEHPELWLSDGWHTVTSQSWRHPLYWERRDGEWWAFTLSGLRKLDPNEPVCHVSYYEADAYARWAGFRLPTEAEWEVASGEREIEGNFADSRLFHPRGSEAPEGLQQMFGDVWEWTQSHYSPYPGYRPAAGAIGEYNGKFMCNQFVLRGGSCATSANHIRRTYRNFFSPPSRWQFMGIRLANDGK